MWFSEIAAKDNPKINELHGFIDGVIRFLDFSLYDEDVSSFLWNDNKRLRELALDTFNNDVIDSHKQMHETIEKLQSTPEPNDLFIRRIHEHGLVGRPMRFKLAVLDTIAAEWQRAKNTLKDKFRGQFKIREWLKKMFDAVDAILDSAIAAVGAGDLIKEFKDAVSALAS